MKKKDHLRIIGLTAMLSLTIGLTACQLMVTSRGAPDRAKRVNVGDILKLNHEIIIPATDASLIFQNGKIQGGTLIDRFGASCHFVMQQILPTPQRVIPDEFIITHIRYWEDSTGFGYRPQMPGPDFINYEFEMRLHSEKQPNVHSLTCKHDDEDDYGRHLRLNEVQQALGPFAQIIQRTPR